jgi:predicted nucleotidyltransferase
VIAADLPIRLDEAVVHDFCIRHHIARLALFGSVLRPDFTPQSDVDVLVEFHPDHVPGLIRLELMQIELEGLLGRKVDLLTPKSLHPSIRGRVVAGARVIYDAA